MWSRLHHWSKLKPKLKNLHWSAFKKQFKKVYRSILGFQIILSQYFSTSYIMNRLLISLIMLNKKIFLKMVVVVVVVWKIIHSESDTSRTGAEDLCLYYPRLLYCPDQMLAVMVLRQDRFLSSKIVGVVLHVVPDVWGTLLLAVRLIG